MQKKLPAGSVKNPPISESVLNTLVEEPTAEPPPYNKFLLAGEGLREGSMCWMVRDERVEKERLLTRRYLSELLLSWPLDKNL